MHHGLSTMVSVLCPALHSQAAGFGRLFLTLSGKSFSDPKLWPLNDLSLFALPRTSMYSLVMPSMLKKALSFLMTGIWVITSFLPPGFSASEISQPASQTQQTITPQQAAAQTASPSIPPPENDSPLSPVQSNAVQSNTVQAPGTITLPPINGITQSSSQNITYPQNVSIDVTQNSGDVYANGIKTGTYKFDAITNDKGEPRFVLKIGMNSNSSNPSTADVHYFMVNADRTTFQLLGSTNFGGEADIVPTAAVWKDIAKFYDNPLSLTNAEYNNLPTLTQQQNASTAPYPFKTASFAQSFTAAYMHRLLDGFTASPGFVFPSGTSFIPSSIFSSINGAGTGGGISPYDTQKIAEHLSLVWNSLSSESAAELLYALRGGNSSALTILGDLAIKQLQRPLPTYLKFFNLTRIMDLMSAVMANLEVPGSLKTQLTDAIFQILKISAPGLSFTFTGLTVIREVFLGKGPATMDYPQIDTLISNFVNSSLAPNYISITLETVLRDMPSYVQASNVPAIEAIIDQAMTDYDGTSPKAQLLLLWMESPLISSQKKAQIDSLLASKGFSQWTSNIYPIGTQGSANTIFSPATLKQFAREVGTPIVARIVSTGTTDLWKSAVIADLGTFMSAFRDSPFWEECVSYLIPALSTLNPKQTVETTEQYAARMAKIQNMLLKDRILINDPTGTIVTTPGHLDAISNYIKNHPGWIHGVTFSTKYGGGDAGYGFVEANPSNYHSPELLTPALVHEGTHLLLREERAGTASLLPLIQTWYYEPDVKDSHSFVSSYSRLNSSEYAAEFMEEWSRDGKFWMQKAFTEYGNGYPAMLNLFIAEMNLQNPLPPPANGLRPLFTVNPTNGFFEREDIPAAWTAGDAKQGLYTLVIDNTTYQITYQNYNITNVTSTNTAADHLGAALKANPAQMAAYNALYNESISASQSITLGQRESLIDRVTRAGYAESVFLQSMMKAYSLLVELRRPENASHLTTYNNLYARSYPIPSSGPLENFQIDALFETVAASGYNQTIYLNSLPAAQQFYSALMASGSLKGALSTLSFDPNQTTLGTFNLFSGNLIYETAVSMGYSAQALTSLLPPAAALLTALRLPENADKLNAFTNLYGFSPTGNTISAAVRKAILDIVAVPGYDQTVLLNALLPAQDLFSKLSSDASLRRALATLSFDPAQTVASPALNQFSTSLLVEIAGMGYPSASLSILAPNAADLLKALRLPANAGKLAAFNSLYGVSAGGTDISGTVRKGLLEIVSMAGYSQTSFLNSLPSAQELYSKLSTDANTRRALATLSFDPNQTVASPALSQFPISLIFETTSMGYSVSTLNNLLPAAADLLKTLRLPANSDKLSAFNTLYGISPATSIPAAMRKVLLDTVSVPGYSQTSYTNSLPAARDLFSKLSADANTRRALATLTFDPNQTIASPVINQFSMALIFETSGLGYPSAILNTLLTEGAELLKSLRLPANADKLNAFSTLYGISPSGTSIALNLRKLLLDISAGNGYSQTAFLSQLVPANNLLTELRKPENASKLTAYNTLLANPPLSASGPLNADLNKPLLKTVTEPGYDQTAFLASLTAANDLYTRLSSDANLRRALATLSFDPNQTVASPALNQFSAALLFETAALGYSPQALSTFLPNAAELLKALRLPANSDKLSPISMLYGVTASESPISAATRKVMLDIVSAAGYSQTPFLNSLPAAGELYSKLFSDITSRRALAALSFDPNQAIASPNLNQFPLAVIFETSGMGYSLQALTAAMLNAADLLKTLRLPANADKLNAFNTLYGVSASGTEISAAARKVLLEIVSMPSYSSQTSFLNSLPAAKELFLKLSSDANTRRALATLSFDPNQTVASPALNQFSLALIFETTGMGYSVSTLNTLLPNAAELLKALRLPANADKLAAFNTLYGISPSGNSISAGLRKTLLDAVSTAGYNQTSFLNSLPAAQDLFLKLSTDANTRRALATLSFDPNQLVASPAMNQFSLALIFETTSVYSVQALNTLLPNAADLLKTLRLTANSDKLNAFNTLYGVSAAGNPVSSAVRKALLDVAAVSGYNQTSFLNTLPAAQELFLRLASDAAIRRALATLTFDPGQTIASPAANLFSTALIMDTVKIGYTSQTLFTLLPAAAELLKTLRLPANAEKLAQFTAVYSLSPLGTEISPALRKQLLDIASASGYSQTNFLNQLAPAAVLAQLRASSAALNAFNKLYAQTIPAQGILTAAQNTFIAGLTSAPSFSLSVFMNRLVPAYDLLTAVSTTTNRDAFNLLFAATLSATAGTAPSAADLALLYTLVSETGYDKTAFTGRLLKVRDLYLAAKSPKAKNNAFDSLYGLGLLTASGLTKAQRDLFFNLAGAANFNADTIVNQWVDADSLMTALRKKANAPELAAYNRIYGASLQLTGTPSASDLQKLLTTVSAAGYKERPFLAGLV